MGKNKKPGKKIPADVAYKLAVARALSPEPGPVKRNKSDIWNVIDGPLPSKPKPQGSRPWYPDYPDYKPSERYWGNHG